MKIAIFHHYFDEIGGAEIVLLHLARGLNAKIFTTNIDKHKINQLGFNDVEIISIGKIPKIDYIKQVFSLLKFSRLKLFNSDYYIFGGSFCTSASKNHKPNLWICFSPARGLYDLRYYETSRLNIPLQILKSFFIKLDKKYISYIQKIIVPSLIVKKRVRKYYNRKSKLIYHPINFEYFYNSENNNYWLSVSRIDPYKRLELQVKAFKKLRNQKLVVIGEPNESNVLYYNHLKKIATKNVSFLGAIYDKTKLSKYYAECKGFIATSKNEDFGLNVIEAMASGKPVITCNEGGYKETVLDGKTGYLIDDLDEDKLVDQIKFVDNELKKNPNKFKEECIKQAKKFSVGVFVNKIKKEIRK